MNDALQYFSLKVSELNKIHDIYNCQEIKIILNSVTDKYPVALVNQFLDVLKIFLDSRYKFTGGISLACRRDFNNASTLLNAFMQLLAYNRDLFDTQFNFISHQGKKAHDFAKILIHLQKTEKIENFKKIQNSEDKTALLEIVYTFWLEGVKPYKYVLKQLLKNPKILILNKNFILAYPSKIFQLNFWFNILSVDKIIFNKFIHLKKEEALHLVESFEILKKSNLFNHLHVTLFLKYPENAMQLAQAITYLNQNEILNKTSMNFILASPEAALQNAYSYSEKIFDLLRIDKFCLKISKFLPSSHYKFNTLINIGNTFIKTIFHIPIDVSFDSDFAATMGIYFLELLNNQNYPLSERYLTKLYFIANRHFYMDPDFEQTDISMSMLDFLVVFNKKCKKFLSQNDNLKKHYNILSILYDVYDYVLPAYDLKEFSLLEWHDAYESLMRRINRERKPDSNLNLQGFIEDLDGLADHIKIENKKDFINLGLKSFIDFDGKDFAALLWILKLTTQPDYQKAKKQCLKSLTPFLIKSEIGKPILACFFKYKCAAEANTCEPEMTKLKI